MGVFRVWGDTWGDVWCDKEKRNVQLGVTFGVTVLTLKMDDCPPFISLFCVIDFENGRLEGGDNPTFWHVPNFCVMPETPCLSGFWLLCYPIIPMYVRARHVLRRGACA